MTKGVFSEFELREMAIKVEDESEYSRADCVGTSEEEMEMKSVTKLCRGIVAKKKNRGTGNGNLKISMHMPYELYTKAYGMNLDTLIEGVKAYGANSIHKELSIVQHVFDEDGVEKYKAYPRAVMEKGVARKIENGAEEVAEVELELYLMPDEFGNGVYEALADDLDETVASTWMTAFTPDLVQKVTA